ncbi:efflux RND transporter periplasmic adaptor subunit [Cognatiyoonia sp. IB215446]|uniref:efflux RND transporter periplasmic adaptor subunit n=1 Tax=Cognatiyoonia sp. IB215446 TaxID=3097355 RepID=UPI002A0D4A2E|nr:efflux RND transporter periplasmic adaptor subunit [Cognatiyoonia sp. IB215446]MDX8350583.1 efflux RND transporter periplasmic adaptor subunit [Cognatiyoonia sp. IB215446]
MKDDHRPDLAGQLRFDSDAGSGRSKWIAIGLALALVLWMGSGFIFPSPQETTEAEDGGLRPVAVAVMPSSAQDVMLVLSAEGQSLPDRATGIRAEAMGQVTEVTVARGDFVNAGQEIGRIDAATTEAQLRQAETALQQAVRDFDNAVSLQVRGIATEDRVTQARATLAAAEASVVTAREQVDDTIIRAPFTGRLNDLTLDEGEFVSMGDVVAEVVDNDPLTVVIQVPQIALSRIEKGQQAEVNFITGESLAGTVGFIGSNADQQTRTFRVEVMVDNPDSLMPAGLSARVTIPTGQARGHFISPAILSLGPEGDLGIKTVEDDATVAFQPVEIVRAQTDGIWVTGLAEKADIITVGQGFVNAGDVVDPRPQAADVTAKASR